MIKLYALFGEYVKLHEFLTSMLKFAEIIDDKLTQASLNTLQLNSLRCFKIKCYSYLGVCLAGLRDFRYSRLCTRKSIFLVDKEIEAKSAQSHTDSTDSIAVNSAATNSVGFVLVDSG